MVSTRGQVVSTKYSGGLGIQEWWSVMLRSNELAFKEKRYDDVQLDTELAATARLAFPDRELSKALVDVQRQRARYNRGVWAKGVPPIVQSKRYGRMDGSLVRVTSRGKIIWRQPKGSVKKIGGQS